MILVKPKSQEEKCHSRNKDLFCHPPTLYINTKTSSLDVVGISHIVHSPKPASIIPSPSSSHTISMGSRKTSNEETTQKRLSPTSINSIHPFVENNPVTATSEADRRSMRSARELQMDLSGCEIKHMHTEAPTKITYHHYIHDSNNSTNNQVGSSGIRISTQMINMGQDLDTTDHLHHHHHHQHHTPPHGIIQTSQRSRTSQSPQRSPIHQRLQNERVQKHSPTSISSQDKTNDISTTSVHVSVNSASTTTTTTTTTMTIVPKMTVSNAKNDSHNNSPTSATIVCTQVDNDKASNTSYPLIQQRQQPPPPQLLRQNGIESVCVPCETASVMSVITNPTSTPTPTPTPPPPPPLPMSLGTDSLSASSYADRTPARGTQEQQKITPHTSEDSPNVTINLLLSMLLNIGLSCAAGMMIYSIPIHDPRLNLFSEETPNGNVTNHLLFVFDNNDVVLVPEDSILSRFANRISRHYMFIFVFLPLITMIAFWHSFETKLYVFQKTRVKQLQKHQMDGKYGNRVRTTTTTATTAAAVAADDHNVTSTLFKRITIIIGIYCITALPSCVVIGFGGFFPHVFILCYGLFATLYIILQKLMLSHLNTRNHTESDNHKIPSAVAIATDIRVTNDSNDTTRTNISSGCGCGCGCDCCGSLDHYCCHHRCKQLRPQILALPISLVFFPCCILFLLAYRYSHGNIWIQNVWILIFNVVSFVYRLSFGYALKHYASKIIRPSLWAMTWSDFIVFLVLPTKSIIVAGSSNSIQEDQASLLVTYAVVALTSIMTGIVQPIFLTEKIYHIKRKFERCSKCKPDTLEQHVRKYATSMFFTLFARVYASLLYLSLVIVMRYGPNAKFFVTFDRGILSTNKEAEVAVVGAFHRNITNDMNDVIATSTTMFIETPDSIVSILVFTTFQIGLALSQLIIYRYVLLRWKKLDYFQTAYECIKDLGWVFYIIMISVPVFVPILTMIHSRILA
jgi:hypothetical protein